MNPQKMIDGVLVERLPDGRIVPVNQGQQGQMPANPEFPYKGPQAGANLRKTEAEIENDRQQRILDRQKFVADLYKEGLQMGPNGPVPIPGWQKPNSAQGGRPDATKAQFDDALAQYNAADYLTKEIGKLRESYAKGPGATNGLAGIGDFFPTPANQGFDKAAGRLRAFAKQGTGTTGGENNSVAEMKLNLGSYIPAASDWDSTNTDTFASLQELANKTREEAIQRLGGTPDASGRIVPLAPQNAMTQNYVLPGAAAGSADRGSDTQSVPVPAGMQQAHQAYIASHAGNLDPMAYARFRAEMDKQYGYPVTPEKEDEYRAFAEQANKAAQRGGSTINPNIPNVDQPLSGLDAFRNNLVNNPLGAAAVGALDMGGFGAVSALAPGQMQSLADESPWNAGAMMVGQIGGAIGGTSALGKLGAETLGRALPKLMQSGSMGRTGRALATDGVYGTVTGTNQGMDPTTAALSSIVGSGAGQALGGMGGRLVGGFEKTPEAAFLNSRGIPTTFGQNVGGFAKSLEDAGTSMPIAGDMIAARRMDSFNGLSRAAFDDAGRPIGVQPQNVGEQGIYDMLGIDGNQGHVGRAYDNATAGVTAPIDSQYMVDVAKARDAGKMLPPDLAGRFDQAIANRIDPLTEGAVYHGSRYEIDGPLNPSMNGVYGPGIYTTPRPNIALQFADKKGWLGVHPFQAKGNYATDDQLTEALNAAKAGGAKQGYAMIDAAERLKSQGFAGVKDGPTQSVYDASNLEPMRMTGEQYQQAMRGIKGYRAETTKPGFEQDYRDALGMGMDALTGQMQRGGGAGVVQGLGNADQSYRMTKVLQKAVQAAKNGSSGELQIPTPAQLNTAATQNANKYGGRRPFAELIDAAQRVLPNAIPDSGTARRLMINAGGLGAIGGAGAGYGAVSEDGALSGTMKALALAGMLGLGGTKKGQAFINKALIERPASVRMAGGLIRKHRGLFGAAGVPLALESSN